VVVGHDGWARQVCGRRASGVRDGGKESGRGERRRVVSAHQRQTRVDERNATRRCEVAVVRDGGGDVVKLSPP
jgi:hypothetical protein